MTTLVTGASGFIGLALVRELVARGEAVRALVRRTSDVAPLRELHIELAYADIREEALWPAVEGCERIYHLAAMLRLPRKRRRQPRPEAQMALVNVEGTRLVLGAARDHRVAKVVHVSSVAAIGEAPGETANETTRHRGYFYSEYERTKYLAEQEAQEAAGRGLTVVPVCPSIVVGPGERDALAEVVARFLNWGRSIWLPDPVLPLVGLDDTVVGLMRAMERGLSARRYILNSENLRLTEFLSLVAEAAGVQQRAYPLPAWAWSLPAGFLYRVTGALGPQRLHYWLTRAIHGAAFDAPRARDGLEVRFTPIREVLPGMLVSLVERGLVRRELPGLATQMVRPE